MTLCRYQFVQFSLGVPMDFALFKQIYFICFLLFLTLFVLLALVLDVFIRFYSFVLLAFYKLLSNFTCVYVCIYLFLFIPFIQDVAYDKNEYAEKLFTF